MDEERDSFGPIYNLNAGTEDALAQDQLPPGKGPGTALGCLIGTVSLLVAGVIGVAGAIGGSTMPALVFVPPIVLLVLLSAGSSIEDRTPGFLRGVALSLVFVVILLAFAAVVVVGSGAG